jgi:hypothetical protein
VAARGLCKGSRCNGLGLANTIKTTGGHGGPPLQLRPMLLLRFATYFGLRLTSRSRSHMREFGECYISSVIIFGWSLPVVELALLGGTYSSACATLTSSCSRTQRSISSGSISCTVTTLTRLSVSLPAFVYGPVLKQKELSLTASLAKCGSYLETHLQVWTGLPPFRICF